MHHFGRGFNIYSPRLESRLRTEGLPDLCTRSVLTCSRWCYYTPSGQISRQPLWKSCLTSNKKRLKVEHSFRTRHGPIMNDFRRQEFDFESFGSISVCHCQLAFTALGDVTISMRNLGYETGQPWQISACPPGTTWSCSQAQTSTASTRIPQQLWASFENACQIWPRASSCSCSIHVSR